jgi:hypothetical protein
MIDDRMPPPPAAARAALAAHEAAQQAAGLAVAENPDFDRFQPPLFEIDDRLGREGVDRVSKALETAFAVEQRGVESLDPVDPRLSEGLADVSDRGLGVLEPSRPAIGRVGLAGRLLTQGQGRLEIGQLGLGALILGASGGGRCDDLL